MSPSVRFAARLALVVLSALVLQVGVFSQLPIAGGRPLVLLLVALSAGFALGPERGAVAGFAAGLGFDLLTTTPVGLGAGVFCVAGHLTGRYRPALRHRSWWQLSAAVGLASAAAFVALVLVGWVLGQRGMAPDRLAGGLLVVSLVNAALAPAARAVMAWAGGGGADERFAPAGSARVR